MVENPDVELHLEPTFQKASPAEFQLGNVKARR